MTPPRTVEQLVTFWSEPTGAPKSLRALLQEAYDRGRDDQEAFDYTEMDNRADDLITKVEAVLGAYRAVTKM